MPLVNTIRTVDRAVGFSLATALCALLLVGPLALPQHATAVPSDQSPEPGQTRLGAAALGALRAQVDRVEAQTAELDRRLERLIEDYDRARQSQDDAGGRLALARLRLARAGAELQAQETLLQRRLSDIYEMGDYSLLTVLVTASGFDDAGARLRFFGLIGEQDAGRARERADLLDRVRALALQIETERDPGRRGTLCPCRDWSL